MEELKTKIVPPKPAPAKISEPIPEPEIKINPAPTKTDNQAVPAANIEEEILQNLEQTQEPADIEEVVPEPEPVPVPEPEPEPEPEKEEVLVYLKDLFTKY